MPELTYNKDIIDGKRIFKLKETKEIWGLLKNIDEIHKLRVDTKQAEVFNYLNNVINDILPSDTFKEANELQNNVSYLAKSLLNGKVKNADFFSDINRFIVKFRKTIELSTNETKKDLVTFRIQIETSEVKLASNAARFKGLEVMEYQQDGFFKYTCGQFENDFKGANVYKNELRQKGFPNAFVVAFQNGERINLEKAIKLAEN